MILYEKHPREYTLLGASAVMSELFSPRFIDFFHGKTVKEIIFVIQNGVFYHFQQFGDRERFGRHILRLVNKNTFNLSKLYLDLDRLVVEYEELITCDEKDYHIEMVNAFFTYYRQIIPIAYMGFDTIDFIDELNKAKRGHYREIITKIRMRAELVYKSGESVFIPRFTSWLSKNILPDYDPDLITYIYYQELKDFIATNAKLPTNSELKERKKLLYVRLFPVDKFELFTGKRAAKIIEYKKLMQGKAEEFQDLTEFKGTVVFQGHAQGKVKIIRGKIDMDKFEENDVLVASMTDPNYLPIMKKASAFITNEGGMLCHAAIVARELKKPCIIGTKFATHALKDGDLVEVDANNGVVKIIQKVK